MRLAVHPSEVEVATVDRDGMTRVWDTESGANLLTFSDHRPGLEIRGVAFSPDGTILASIDSDRVMTLRRTDGVSAPTSELARLSE